MSAATNVVRLPTAARRKPDNHRFAEQRRAALELCRASRFAERYQCPVDRKSMTLAKQLREIEQTPALIIASAILRCIDANTYTRIVEQIAPGVVGGKPVYHQALATIRASRLTVSEQHYLLNAFARLDRGGR